MRNQLHLQKIEEDENMLHPITWSTSLQCST